MRHILIGAAAFAAVTALQLLPAGAIAIVLGAGRAHDCFAMAKAGVNPHLGISYCDEALDNERLGRYDRAATLINRGVMKIALGDITSAMEDYNSGLALRPDLGDAFIDRGAAFISLKRYDEAMQDINRGIELGMTYPQMGYYNRGVAEEFQSKWKDSYFDFKHALEIDPEFIMARNQLKNFTVTTVAAKP